MNLIQLRITASRANRGNSVTKSIAQENVQWGYEGKGASDLGPRTFDR
jgi:hypothetical protein